ncbi:uncharacterized protein LOC110467323 [Mizuhopecten yessoensis]|uniref:Sushi domain-containing protein n=1 Tax=Mizuhopecten yessoensis TaxID=6573 RepID=A0A210PM74_MIZYE|nr:uncharacterized protein LOC110467323 [Mizuhopecten yessoensis]OWF37567.1 hypothetical protein KP79_PYT07437 [Mizuhopecten yessoensis]
MMSLLRITLTCLCVTATQGVCTEPITPEYGFPLTDSQTSYPTNATYDLFCLPAYTISGESTLTCLSSGSWNYDTPTCAPSEGTYPWWLLLVMVVVVIILVPCVAPRIIFCCCCKKDEKASKTNEGYNHEPDEESDDEYDYEGWGPSEEMTDYGRGKKTNMDVMPIAHPEMDKKQFARATKNSNF